MIYDIIIIGGGPAGITAGIYAARKKLKTLLISRDFVGEIGKALFIENYPGFKEITGLELIGRLKEHLKKYEIEIQEGEEVKEIKKRGDGFFEIKTGPEKKYLSKVVIIATGRDPRPLKVPGEKEFLGKGVSYCVTCDGPLFSGKKVVIIGGGNSGFKAAFELAKHCPKVYILESSPEVKADEIEQERANNLENVQVLTNVVLKEIRGKNFVENITYQNRETKTIKEIPIDGVFVEIGYIPATSFVKDLVDFNERDEIKINPKNCVAKTAGLFAAGDVTDIEYKQIVIAVGEGAKAALSAYEYLKNLKF